MTTKKRHDRMRTAKAVRLTAAKPKKQTEGERRRARMKARVNLRDVVKAARDSGMDVKIGIKPITEFNAVTDAMTAASLSRKIGKLPALAAEFNVSAAGTGDIYAVTAEAIDSLHPLEAWMPDETPKATRFDTAGKIGEEVDRLRTPRFEVHGTCKLDSTDECCDTRDCQAAIGKRAHEIAERIMRETAKTEGGWGLFAGYPRVHGYFGLEEVLARAYNQAASGKGVERHGRGRSFDEQPTQIISDMLDSDAGLAFPAIKKVNEGMRLDHDAKIKEMLGAINYIASIVIHMERNKK